MGKTQRILAELYTRTDETLYIHGFVISDHVDFPDLIETINQSKANDVLVGFTNSPAFVRYVREEMGYDRCIQLNVRY